MMKTIFVFLSIPGMAVRQLLLLMIFFLTVNTVFAQTTTWNGGVSNEWTVAGNWSAGVPGADLHVVISSAGTAPVIGESVSAQAKSMLVEAGATLTIQAEGSLTINGFASYSAPFATTAAFNNLGTFINGGQMILGSTSGIGDYGILSQGTFTNSGSIQINNSSDTGIYNVLGTFSNEGSIVIGDVAAVGNHGIWNDDVFQNKSAGVIRIDRTSLRGLVNNSAVSGGFTTKGLIVIGAKAAVGTNGLENRGSLAVEGCGQLLVLRGSFLNETSKTVVNGGLIRVNNNLNNKGTFTNNSVVKYGSITGSITNNNMVVNNAPAQILSYGPGSRGLDGIFTDSLGTVSAGTFTFPNTYVTLSTVPYGTSLLYFKMSVEGCPYVVPFTYQKARPASTTWTGTASSLWSNAANWESGVPDEFIDAIIPSKTNDPEITGATAAFVKSLLVQEDATLTIQSTGSLTINGLASYQSPFSLTAGLYNLGTIRNSGNIVLGSVSAVGAFGLVNRSTFTNDTGSEIHIDRISDTGLYNTYNATFTNKGAITIGAVNAVGWVHGIYNESVFNNSTGGNIKIDRSATAGIRNRAGTFSNAADITIGTSASAGSYGIQNDDTFNHSAGNIKIDDCSDTGLYNTYTGTFTNKATLTIGSVKTVGVNGIFNALVFNNTETGVVNVVRATTASIRNYGDGTFTNSKGASITLGATAAGFNGIRNEATFLNTTGSQITIDNASASISGAASISNEGIATFTNSEEAVITIGTVSAGLNGIRNAATFLNTTSAEITIDHASAKALHNQSTGVFTNDLAAHITIGAIAAGSTGLENQHTFLNSTGGQIKIDHTISTGLSADNSSNFTNEALIVIGGAGAATPSVSGISNSGNFSNSADGEIQIDNTSYSGLYHGYNSPGIFNNSGKITIGAKSSVGTFGLGVGSTFNNNATGVIKIDRTSEYGLSQLSVGKFTNSGKLTIGETASVGNQGIVVYGPFDNKSGGEIYVGRADQGVALFTKGTFENSGALTVGSAANPVSDLITQTTSEAQPYPFKNNTGGSVKGSGNIKVTFFTHNGGAVLPGYSPGSITFTGNQDFTNSILNFEANDIGTAGEDFDQIVVSGTATLGGTLALAITHTGVDGDEMIILSATAVSGEFTTVTGLPLGWKVEYGSTTVKLVYDATLPVTLVAFYADASGTGVRLQWQTTTEINNKGFYIERSSNGRNWNEIGFVDGSGTISQRRDYDFRDENPVPGINYYRLRQTDLDGKIEYSRIRFVNLENPDKDLIVWADAARQAHIQTEDHVEQVTVFDLSGRVLIISKEASLNLSNVPAGILIIRVQTDRGLKTRKLWLR